MSVNEKWYEGFFQGLMVEVWRKAMTPEQTRDEVDFLESALRLGPAARVLDAPCGFGRHSLELAARGYRPTGVDQSPEMIDAARDGASRAVAAIEWRLADMRDLPWEEQFDGAFCLGNSFGYLDAAGTRRFLNAVARALKPGARFALDYGMAAECILPRFRAREETQVDDILFIEENEYLVSDGCIETTYTLVRDGERLTLKGSHWVYTVRETVTMLRDAGLETKDVFSSFGGDPFTLGSTFLVLVAQKA